MSEQSSLPLELTPEEIADVILINGQAHPELGESIAAELGIPLHPVTIRKHPNDDVYVRLEENVRGRNVFILQPHVASPGFSLSDSARVHNDLIFASFKSGAEHIRAIAPTYQGARQDRRASSRESLSSKLTLMAMHKAGAEELITMDPHNLQAFEAFDGVTTPITARNILLPPILEYIGDEIGNTVVIGGDEGSAKLARGWGKVLGVPHHVYSKDRDLETQEVTHPDINEYEVREKIVVVPEDMIDTAGSLESLVNGLRNARAARVYVAATHMWLSGNAIQSILDMEVDAIVGTDTIPTQSAEEVLKDKLKIMKTGGIHADTVRRIIRKESVSEQSYGDAYS